MTVPPFRFDIKLSWVFLLLILMKYSVFFSFQKDALSPLVRGLVKEIFKKGNIVLKIVMEKFMSVLYKT